MAMSPPGGNPRKQRREAAPVRGKLGGKAVGQSPPTKRDGSSNEPHGSTNRRAYDSDNANRPI